MEFYQYPVGRPCRRLLKVHIDLMGLTSNHRPLIVSMYVHYHFKYFCLVCVSLWSSYLLLFVGKSLRVDRFIGKVENVKVVVTVIGSYLAFVGTLSYKSGYGLAIQKPFEVLCTRFAFLQVGMGKP